MRSLRLRSEPSVRQTQAILARIERELADRGARVARTGASALRFDTPRPWRSRKLDALALVNGGRIAVNAGSGEPRRVRYKLKFTWLRVVAILASFVLLAVGWEWQRAMLLNALLVLWAVVFGAPYALAEVRFRRLLQIAARDVIERRRSPRATPTPDSSPAIDPGSPPPEA